MEPPTQLGTLEMPSPSLVTPIPISGVPSCLFNQEEGLWTAAKVDRSSLQDPRQPRMVKPKQEFSMHGDTATFINGQLLSCQSQNRRWLMRISSG